MGQGRTHAVAFAKAGFDVVLIDMLEPENEIFKETIALVRDAGGEVLALQANICSTPEVEAAFAQAWESLVAWMWWWPMRVSSILVTLGN